MSSENANQVNEEVFKDPSEMSEAEIKAERAKLELVRSRLELAKLRRDNEVAKAAYEDRVKRDIQQARNYEELRKRDLDLQTRCNHRKGGVDMRASAKQGDSNYHSVIHHTGTYGGTTVLCTRCCKLWLPQDPDNGGKPTPGYAEAIRFQTDNQPSSSVVFQAQQAAPVAA